MSPCTTRWSACFANHESTPLTFGARTVPVALLLLTLFLHESAYAQTASEFLDPPPLTTSHFLEDYSYLRDPNNRTGAWWERVKFVPLTPSGWAYLSLAHEVRLRFEHYTNNNFGSGPKPTESYLRFRDMPYAEIRLGDHVSAFGELIVAYGDRSVVTKSAFTDQTGVDVLQGHLRARLGDFTIGAGRVVLIYGSGRLINAGPNIRNSYQGVRPAWHRGRWDVESFYGRPVLPGLESFDNEPDRTRKMWSVYVTHNPPKDASGAGFDVYYIGFRNNTARFNQGLGRENRQTFGVRHFGKNGGWDYDTEGIVQVGTFNAGQIRAWAAGTILRHTYTHVARKPFIEGRLTFVSGDHDPDDPDLGTFNPINAPGGYFGENGVIGPFNLINLRMIAGLEFAPGWTLSGSGVLYWRASVGDGLYGLGGNLLRPDMGSRARFVGPQADVSIAWAVNRNLNFNLAYSVLAPGRFVKDTGPAETVHFVGSQVQFKF